MDRLTPGPTLITGAYDSILAAICDGRLPPGVRLNQDQLAGRMHVSRQPVGQALSILKSQGFVRDNGRRGVIIPPLDREFFRAIYQLREALDPLAARLAAQHCTREEIAAARRLLSAGRKAVRARVIDSVIAADVDFHAWIYRVAGNPLLVETMGIYWNHLRRAMGEVLRRVSTRGPIWDEHQAIFEAIVEGDGAQAARLSLAHVRDAAERIVESIPTAPVGTGAGIASIGLAARSK